MTYVVPALAFLKEKERETIRKRERMTMHIIMCVQPMTHSVYLQTVSSGQDVAAGEVC